MPAKKEFCAQRTKIDNKVKFASAILLLAILLIALAIIWPFFKKEVIPVIKRGIEIAWDFLGDVLERFFEMIRELFQKETPEAIGDVYVET